MLLIYRLGQEAARRSMTWLTNLFVANKYGVAQGGDCLVL